MPEVLKALQVRQLRVRGTIGEIATGSYVIRLKVLPQDTTTEHQKIVDSVSGALPSPAKVRAHRIEPIAFGLSAIIMDIVAPEEEGMIEKIEAAVSSAPLVGQSDMMGVSRMSSKLPT